MPVESNALNAFNTPAATGGVKAFLLAHPVGVTIVGGALLGLGVYYIAKKMSGPKEETAKA